MIIKLLSRIDYNIYCFNQATYADFIILAPLTGTPWSVNGLMYKHTKRTTRQEIWRPQKLF